MTENQQRLENGLPVTDRPHYFVQEADEPVAKCIHCGDIDDGTEEPNCCGPLSDPLQKLVDEQAEDEMLWFATQNITEAYLQQELRRLHAAIENRPAVSGQAAEGIDWAIECIRQWAALIVQLANLSGADEVDQLEVGEKLIRTFLSAPPVSPVPPTARDEIANLKAELASVKAHDASSVSNWEFALQQRDEARAELQRLRDEVREEMGDPCECCLRYSMSKCEGVCQECLDNHGDEELGFVCPFETPAPPVAPSHEHEFGQWKSYTPEIRGGVIRERRFCPCGQYEFRDPLRTLYFDSGPLSDEPRENENHPALREESK